jgi:hypothetical protein
MNPDMNERERFEELRAERALFGLDASREEELRALGARLGLDDDESLDEAAALLTLGLAGEGPVEEMPSDVRDRIETDAAEFFGGSGAVEVVSLEDHHRSTREAPRTARWGWFAAAACLALALWGWFGPEGEGFTPAERRGELIANAGDEADRAPWTATEDVAAVGATGDVIWSDTLQEGYMVFKGLAANDPDTWQYQLWIFDAERDERYPVDGGVFDIPAGATEVVVPIRAKIPVGDAVLFAVTVEKPGGVVVSSRERIVVLADVNAAEG